MDATMKSLREDVAGEGHLVNPGRWGLQKGGDGRDPSAEKNQASSAASAGRNKGSISEELKFWEDIKTGNLFIDTQ